MSRGAAVLGNEIPKRYVSNEVKCGVAGIELIATLPTANPCLQRPLWSRRIEKAYDRVQSKANFWRLSRNFGDWPLIEIQTQTLPLAVKP